MLNTSNRNMEQTRVQRQESILSGSPLRSVEEAKREEQKAFVYDRKEDLKVQPFSSEGRPSAQKNS